MTEGGVWRKTLNHTLRSGATLPKMGERGKLGKGYGPNPVEVIRLGRRRQDPYDPNGYQIYRIGAVATGAATAGDDRGIERGRTASGATAISRVAGGT
jgi:hypothetical protein